MNEGLPIPQLQLEFAFQVKLFFDDRVRFEPRTPMGGRVYVRIAHGEVTGPRLQGRAIPQSGADWARGRADGVAELNAHYMLEASDGTPIYLYNRGYLYGRQADGRPLPPEERPTNFEVAQSTYFVITPVFDVPAGPHDWLTRTVIVGMGERLPGPGSTLFTYYTVKN
jgi:hypothetical protein